jgi:hypothetical protein
VSLLVLRLASLGLIGPPRFIASGDCASAPYRFW